MGQYGVVDVNNKTNTIEVSAVKSHFQSIYSNVENYSFTQFSGFFYATRGSSVDEKNFSPENHNFSNEDFRVSIKYVNI